MTGAIFTKIGLGIGFFTLIFLFGINFLVDMGNEYNVVLDANYQNKFNTQSAFTNINYETIDIVEGGSIDQKTTDIAQLQGGLAAQRNQLNFFGIIKTAITDLNTIIPFAGYISAILYSLLSIMLLAGILYLLFGRF
jgi:hypothetical protein